MVALNNCMGQAGPSSSFEVAGLSVRFDLGPEAHYFDNSRLDDENPHAIQDCAFPTVAPDVGEARGSLSSCRIWG